MASVADTALNHHSLTHSLSGRISALRLTFLFSVVVPPGVIIGNYISHFHKAYIDAHGLHLNPAINRLVNEHDNTSQVSQHRTSIK